MSKKEEYKPFGMEWELELMKFKKQGLVEMLRGALIRNNEIKDIIDEMINGDNGSWECRKYRLQALTELRSKL